MVAYVLGHGWHDSGKSRIRVPDGMTFSFMADFDLSGLAHVQLAQLLVGSPGAAQTYRPPDEFPNYEFEQFSDDLIARLIQLNTHSLDLWIIGPDCPAFALCSAPDSPSCSSGQHDCEDGLLGIARAKGVSELHLMCCRVDVAVEAWLRRADTNLPDLEGNADPTVHQELFEWTSWFISLGYADQCAAWNAMPYEQQAYCTSDNEISQWAAAHQAEQLFGSGGDTVEFRAYYDRLDAVVKERLLRDFPNILAAVSNRLDRTVPAEYVDTINTFIYMSLDQQDEYWKELHSAYREIFLTDPRVNDWAQAQAAREYLDLGATPATFKGYCAKLSVGANQLLRSYPGTASYFVQ
jgi:hypothetical protein